MPRRKAILTPQMVERYVEPAMKAVIDDYLEPVAPALTIPADWTHGALLNVRCQGDYVVTLFPEEYDYRHPERALRFNNSAHCQNFVSKWYARESFDGRAF